MIEKNLIMDETSLNRAIVRISHEIIERNKGVENVVLVGIITRGLPMAKKISENIEKIENIKVPVESIDITLYRDDLSEVNDTPVVNEEQFDIDVKDKHVILVDDVIFTGRTVRAAIEAVLKKGRPKTIQLAVMIDRGHRELPIRPDYVGKNIPTSLSEMVSVQFVETDGTEKVTLFEL